MVKDLFYCYFIPFIMHSNSVTAIVENVQLSQLEMKMQKDENL